MEIKLEHRIPILIPLFNGLEYTKKCVASLLTHTDPNLYEVLFIDNGSTDDTPKYLKQLVERDPRHFRVITLEKNLGFGGGLNRGLDLISRFKWEYGVIANNDLLFTPKWLEQLLTAMNTIQIPKLGMVGPMSNFAGGTQGMQAKYKDVSELDKFASMHHQVNKGKWHEAGVVVGLLMLFRRQFVDEVGFFDERFFPGTWEENDWELRGAAQGWRYAVDRSTFIHHYGSKTMPEVKESQNQRQNFTTNRDRFRKKWSSAESPWEALAKERYELRGQDPEKYKMKDGRYRKWVVAACRVKDGAKFLEKTLPRVSEFADEIVILVDQHSKDNTEEVCKRFSKVVAIEKEPPHKYNEAWSRNRVLQMAFDRHGDWIYAFDSDEVIDKRAITNREELTDPVDPAICLWIQPIVQLWNSENTQRVDGVWGTFYQGRMFRVLPGQNIDNANNLVHCFPAGVEVATCKDNKLLSRPIEQVEVGDLVLTHKNRWRPVIKTFQRETNKDLIELNFYGRTVRSTSNHRYLAVRTEECARGRHNATHCWPGLIGKLCRTCTSKPHLDYKTAWIKAEDLREGDYVVQMSLADSDDRDLEQFDQNEGFLLGAFLGDGYYRHEASSTPHLTFGIHETELRDETRTRAEVCGIHTNVCTPPSIPGAQRVSLGVRGMTSKLRNAFKGADHGRQKRGFYSFLNQTTGTTEHILRGLIETDGHIVKGRQVAYDSASGHLSLLFNLLARKVGLCSTQTETFSWLRGKRHKIYRTFISGIENSAWCKRWFDVPEAKIGKHSGTRKFGKHFCSRIRKISRVPHQGAVYNLHVLDDNSYTANGHVVHNCGSTPLIPQDRQGFSYFKIAHYGNVDQALRQQKHGWYTKTDTDKDIGMALGHWAEYYWKLYYGEPTPQDRAAFQGRWKAIPDSEKWQRPPFGCFYDRDVYRHVYDESGMKLVPFDEDRKVSLCMLVKDEAGYLPRAISSVRPFIDELIVIDTGSVDGSDSVAEQLGAKVFKFDWVHDFSKARNFSLSKATGDWILRIDPDETIPFETAIQIPTLIRDKKMEGYIFPIVNWLQEPGSVPNPSWALSETCRLYKNQYPTVRYANPVHEELDDSLKALGERRKQALKEQGASDEVVEKGGKAYIAKVPYQIYHYGYLKGRKFLDKKFDYYYQLGKKHMADMPEDARPYFNTSVHLLHVGKYSEAMLGYKKVIELDPKNHMAFNDVGVILSSILCDYGQAEKYFKKALDAMDDNTHPEHRSRVERNLEEVRTKLLTKVLGV